MEVEGGVERSPCALESPQFASIHLTLRNVEFDGLQGMTRAELASAYSPYVGRDLPVSVVCEIRDRAATILRNAGYIAAVEVPEQRITDGVVRLRVLMAHLTQIRVRGNATGAERIIAGYLNQLTKEPVFNKYDAERYLLLATDLPGYNVRLSLRPAGGAPGDVIGDVIVQRIPVFSDVQVQNLGSQELGPWGALLRGEFFGLTGLGDATTVSVFSTADLKEQQTLQLGHSFKIGPEGLSLSSNFTYAWAKPSVPNADILAKTLFGTVELGYPIVRSQAKTVRGSLGMDYVNQNVDFNHSDLTRDKLRVAFLRLGFDAQQTDLPSAAWNQAEPPWHIAALAEYRQGLHIFGATPSCGHLGENCLGPGDVPPSRIEGQSNAAEIRYTAFGEYRPIPKLTFALGVRAQYAWKPLLSFEEYSAGNYTVGRGYDPGALLGDSGFGTQTELRFGSAIPASIKRAAVQGYAFWDYAMVRNRDTLFTLPGSQHLNSVGAGARVNFSRFALDAVLAVPLNAVPLENNNKRPDPRFLITLTSRLWPWSYQ